jgi:integrase
VDILDWVDLLKVKRCGFKDRRAEDERTLSWQTRKHVLNLLRRFFKWAKKRGLIESIPMDDVQIEREDGDEEDGFRDGWYLTRDEQEALLHLADPIDRDAIQLAMGTGLRLNELNCLHLSDVHVDGDRPHIVVRYGSYDRKGKRFRTPKGRKGEKKQVRVVPLFGVALEAARRWLSRLAKYAKQNPHTLMFPTLRGAVREKPPRTWKATVERFARERPDTVARLGRRPWWHLLRHTCASSLVAGWWGYKMTLFEVQTIMGHSTIVVTQRYAHLASDVVAEIGTKAEAAYQLRRQAVVTTPEITDNLPGYPGTSKPNVVSSNLTGRADDLRFVR